MLRSHSRIEKRAAFTLIELMVVVLIIAVLVSMLLAGVSAALRRGPIVQTRVEIGQLETAVQTVITTYRLKYLPSVIKLNEQAYPTGYPNMNTIGTDDYYSTQFLKRMFPRIDFTKTHDWNGNNTIDSGNFLLEGPECLVFFLGGPNNRGFSADPSDPANKVSLQPAAFTFDISRLVLSSRVHTYHVYNNNYGKHALPYLYFSSYNSGNDYSGPHNPMTLAYGLVSDCEHSGVYPYKDPATGNYINPQTFQIISAGAQGVYGFGNTLWSPISGSTDPHTKDNQANFAPGLLVAGQ